MSWPDGQEHLTWVLVFLFSRVWVRVPTVSFTKTPHHSKKKKRKKNCKQIWYQKCYAFFETYTFSMKKQSATSCMTSIWCWFHIWLGRSMCCLPSTRHFRRHSWDRYTTNCRNCKFKHITLAIKKDMFVTLCGQSNCYHRQRGQV